eukprot:4633866-Amphidinium_carterae.1
MIKIEHTGNLGLVVSALQTSWPLPLGFNIDVPEIMGLDAQHFLVPTKFDDHDGTATMWTLLKHIIDQ